MPEPLRHEGLRHCGERRDEATQSPAMVLACFAALARRELVRGCGEEVRVKIDERDDGVLAFVDADGRIWAQCARPSQYAADTDYVIEGPLSGFIYEEGTFTPDSEQAFRAWLDDRLISDGIFHVKDKETALSLCRRIAVAARAILTDRSASSRCPR
ncbi:hypothetical protein ACQR09_26595 [Bradyrhizobium oligotrophicum]|uniref:hypothetical protein n=1 Tax=Bradyrhizobium oligotrophicum TaxID=44255 RepID=UPI003EBF74E3